MIRFYGNNISTWRMLVTKDELISKLRQVFPEAEIELRDLTGAGDHYELVITDVCFKEHSMLIQHRMINNALQEFFDQGLHALTIKVRKV